MVGSTSRATLADVGAKKEAAIAGAVYLTGMLDIDGTRCLQKVMVMAKRGKHSFIKRYPKV